MANNKKVLTIDNLVTFKKLLEESGIGGSNSSVNLDDLEFKTINGQSIKGTGDIQVVTDITLKTINGKSLKGSGNIDTVTIDLLVPAWNASIDTAYELNDLVAYNNKIYICINAHNSYSYSVPGTTGEDFPDVQDVVDFNG